MSRIWDCFMFRNELDMLEARLCEYEDRNMVHVLCEAPVTHRGIPKPLVYEQNKERFAKWSDSIVHVVASGLDEPMPPWTREHRQRDSAWSVVTREAADDDVVLIADCDEFPSAEALAWAGNRITSLWMRTMLFAVDWEVPPKRLPPTAVMATAGWLRAFGGGLAGARDQRGSYPVIRNGGMHLSWVGGVERQQQKLLTSTCHTELLNTEEGGLILTGERYRTGQHGAGHLPVRPVDVDEAWPAYIRERRCPENWWRPRDE